MLNLPNPVPVQIRSPDMRLRIPAPQECLVTRSSRTEDDLAGLWCLHPHAEMLSDSDGLDRALPQSISAPLNDLFYVAVDTS